MIADDTITFVKNDISIFGVGVLIFIILVLYLVFQNYLWVIVSLGNCIIALVIMVGIVSFMNWKITVISSNFISLMLILTLSMTVHIVVRYRQLLINNENLDQIDIIKLCCKKMIKPCLFTALTTIFAFGSLYFSGIKPVMDFGLMMCLGLTITLITSFIFLPIVLSKFKLKSNLGDPKIRRNIFLFILIIKNYSTPSTRTWITRTCTICINCIFH